MDETRKNNQIPQTKAAVKKTNYKSYFPFFIFISAMAFIIAKDVPIPTVIMLPVGVVGLLALGLGSFFNPELSLLILVAYVPFSKILIGRFDAQITGLNLTNVLIFIVTLGWLANCYNTRKKIFTKSSLNLVVLLFCLWGFFSLMMARFLYGEFYDLESFFILFKRWVTPIFLYFIGLNMVKNRETFKKVMFVAMFSTFIIALMAIRDYMNVGGGSLEESRVGGVFEQPNMLGAFFVYNMFFFLSFFLYYYRSLKYWLLLIPFLACLRGIMVTFSRGAYLAFGAGGIMTTFFRSKVLFIIAMFLFMASLINPIYLPQGMRERLASTFGGEKVMSTNVEDITDKSAGNRIIIWKGAIEMIKAKPMFGFGYGTFPYIIGYFIPAMKDVDAHNTYLIIAAEMGIPALLIFLLILFMLIKNAVWLLKRTKERYFKAFAVGILGNIFGLLLANMFGSRLNSEEVSSYFWIYAGLIMAAVNMKKKGEIN
ncbi:MAG: hypothetical protein A2Y00_03610 [Omnitrophica WOR_2 bacterium GWF2_43_52]|nr:MAG: hypothetical protein A2Y01_04565 [Omnitrophica WOR_2 bacterium GWC2_44_8]OGX22519.1 MAG: hypothetical protein A2Y00_03610 [Omnitrophica WOR_2 bacterium GWF2_43_52]OGX54995.1 MAG: hypothetical protein A2460_05770 [Omnitrophica WOR_2 bacterium RIFOXYC2_FULL_43_9]HAH21476.1 hypothetical protein [Candidatus Omnitrophota bacterium]HBG64608.1 hypothetical protein [Candidatus Omnitrophota bacterium]